MWKKPGPLGWTGGSHGRRRRGRPSRTLFTFLFFPSVFPLKRAPSLELCAPRTLGLKDFFGAALLGFFRFCFHVVYISLRDE